jgi:hypothetical protein
VNARFSLLHCAAIGLAAIASSASTCGPSPVQTLDCSSDAACNTSGHQNGTCDLNTKRCTYPAASISTTATLPQGGTVTLERDANGRLRLPLGMVGAAYKVKLQATGGDTTYSWTCDNCSRTFTAGLYLDDAGLISGTPTAKATDVCPSIAVRSGGNKKVETFCLTVADRQPNRLTPASPLDSMGNVQISNAIINMPYKDSETGLSVTLKITGGERAPYSIAMVGGSLPAGMTLSTFTDKQAAYARVTGTPTQAGTYFFSVKASDAIYDVHGIVDQEAATMIQKMFSVTVLDCANTASVAGQCIAGVANECTCAVGDPCNWDHDGKCQQACWRFHDRFDDSLDCPNCADATFVAQSCAAGKYNECTCSETDPCHWRGDGFCDSKCQAFYFHFEDSSDCLDCTNTAAVQGFCQSGTHNACTCAASDPCGWRYNNKCDDACQAFSGSFDDSSDCSNCSNAATVQSACDGNVVNACTCAASDPCGWRNDGFCDSACNAFATHFDDAGDCMNCSDTAAVQQACQSAIYNKCTCSANDPCNWASDGFCDSTMCSAYPNHFTEAYSDCH